MRVPARLAALVLTLCSWGVSEAAPVTKNLAMSPRSAIRQEAPADVARGIELEAASLAAAQEANRIAKDQLAAEIAASDQQFNLGLGALAFSALAALAAMAAAFYARNAWRENRRSADVAERVLTGYERPFLLVEVVKSGVTFDENTTTFDVVKYRFRNLGRVPALITRQYFQIQSAVGLPEPIDPDKEQGRPVVHGVAVGAIGKSEILETGRALPLISALKPDRRPVRGSDGVRGSVFFHGFVEYRDLSGRGWITGFCFEQSRNETGFEPVGLWTNDGPDPFNYDRRQDVSGPGDGHTA